MKMKTNSCKYLKWIYIYYIVIKIFLTLDLLENVIKINLNLISRRFCFLRDFLLSIVCKDRINHINRGMCVFNAAQ